MLNQTGLVLDNAFCDYSLPSDYRGRGTDKIVAMIDHFESDGITKECTPIQIAPASEVVLARTHDLQYLENLKIDSEQCLDGEWKFWGELSDVNITNNTFPLVLLSSGTIINAIDCIMKDEVHNAFCALSPGGHHSDGKHAMGFCLANQESVAVDHLINQYGLSRIAVIDWDVHHGNGTQKIFYEDGRVWFISIHQENLYPKKSGSVFERGVGDGLGRTTNIPMPVGSTEADYKRRLTPVLKRVRDEFSPQFVIITCGFDMCRGDALGRIMLEPRSLNWLTDAALTVAFGSEAKGKVLSLSAGGYKPGIVAVAAGVHVKRLINFKYPDDMIWL